MEKETQAARKSGRTWLKACLCSLALSATACLEDHPVLDHSSVLDPRTILARDSLVTALDSVLITLVDVDDTNHVVPVWDGRLDSLHRLALHLGGDGEEFRLEVRGFKGKRLCYSESYRNGSRTLVRNSCGTANQDPDGLLSPSIDIVWAKPETTSVGDGIEVFSRANVRQGKSLNFYWDFTGDGVIDVSDRTEPPYLLNGAWTYTEVGEKTIRLRIMDDSGFMAEKTLKVVVITDAPTVDAGPDLVVPADSFFRIEGRAEDRMGSILAKGWAMPFDSIPDGMVTTLALVAPPNDTLLTFIYSAIDDDDNMSSDTVVVTVRRK